MQNIISTFIGIILSSYVPLINVDNLDKTEIKCMADNIYFEGRGESINGQIAIANVTLNRVKSDKFPNTVCGVVHQGFDKSRPWILNKCQFSWYCDGKSDKIQLFYTKGKKKGQIIESTYKSYSTAVRIAILVMTKNITDNTYGATHYYAYKIVTPLWAKEMIFLTKIGNHIFLKPN